MITKPMLACTLPSISSVVYPCYVSPKLDGIRCVIQNGLVLSRKFKDIPNKYIRDTLLARISDINKYHCSFDGELLIPNGNFNDVQSAVMSVDGEPNFVYHVFDFIDSDLSVEFTHRQGTMRDIYYNSFMKLVPQYLCNNETEFTKREQEFIDDGYEGIMMRSPSSPYKCNRSTLKEFYLVKYKRFHDSEGEIVGFVEGKHNTNEKELNELGESKRSHKKEFMVDADTLGSMVIRDVESGIIFNIATGKGLTLELKKKIWDNQAGYLGKIITYKYQKIDKDKPNFGTFKSFYIP